MVVLIIMAVKDYSFLELIAQGDRGRGWGWGCLSKQLNEIPTGTPSNLYGIKKSFHQSNLNKTLVAKHKNIICILS